MTNLKILIWETPSLSLGTYLGISTGTGFIISYILTSNLAAINKTRFRRSISYQKNDEIDKSIDLQYSNNYISYDNTLIERDIRDPSPTLNANFRVIGKNINKNNYSKKNYRQEYNDEDFNDESEDFYNNQMNNYSKDNDHQNNPIINDWNDNSYSDW